MFDPLEHQGIPQRKAEKVVDHLTGVLPGRPTKVHLTVGLPAQLPDTRMADLEQTDRRRMLGRNGREVRSAVTGTLRQVALGLLGRDDGC